VTVVPAISPCGSCPYRRDVPSGVWAPDEYAKLPPYDDETWEQPAGMFLCHQQDGRLCAGWVGCHDMDESLAIRLAAGSLSEDDLEAIRSYESPVPLFASGAEAAAHGLAAVEAPDEDAVRTIRKLSRRREVRSQ
jgi:hypothetical protein